MHQTALAAARQVGDRPGLARALTLLFALHFMTNDRVAAVATSRQALAQYCHLGDRVGQADAINRLGFMYRLSGDYRPEESPCGPSPGLGGSQRWVSWICVILVMRPWLRVKYSAIRW